MKDDRAPLNILGFFDLEGNGFCHLTLRHFTQVVYTEHAPKALSIDLEFQGLKLTSINFSMDWKPVNVYRDTYAISYFKKIMPKHKPSSWRYIAP